jgi:PiT family inorganic phosphate transporter
LALPWAMRSSMRATSEKLSIGVRSGACCGRSPFADSRVCGSRAAHFALRHIAKDRHLYEPPQGERPPTLWVRCLLILTCTSVSFSHGTNDGQKSIGLIMLTIIGLMPAVFALNPQADAAVRQLAYNAGSAAPLIAKYGDDQKQIALQSVQRLEQAGAVLTSAGAAAGPNDRSGRSSMPPDPAPSPQQSDPGAGRQEGPAAMRSGIRNEVYRLISELKSVAENSASTPQEKAQANRIRGALRPSVEYAPWWVRVLSATCLGLGTMIGCKRIVHTLG